MKINRTGLIPLLVAATQWTALRAQGGDPNGWHEGDGSYLSFWQDIFVEDGGVVTAIGVSEEDLGSGFSEFIPGGPVDLTVTYTYFKEPKLGVIGLGSCYYEKTACTGGTVPTCAGGVGVAAYLPPCPPYSISFFLVVRSATHNACTVTFSLEALGPGPCT